MLDSTHPTGGSAPRPRRRCDSPTALALVFPAIFGFGAARREALRLLARLRGVAGIGRAEALAERFHADLKRPLGQLSRGNRQKIGLILATFHEPELLILDEPTGGLDPLMQEEFLALVGEERERGCTVFVSSHDLDEVQRICDRVGIVREGRLIAVERMADLLGKARRKVSVRLAEADPLEDLRALPEVSGFSILDGRAGFEVAGDFDRPQADYQEVFLGYYREEGEG